MEPSAAVAEIVEATQSRLAVLTQRRLTGSLSTLDWRIAVSSELRSAHVAATAIAHGGLGNLTPSERGWVGSQLREQGKYLSSFALDIAQGRLSDAQALARAQLYGEAVWGGYQEATRRQARSVGMAQERNVLGGGQHCDECPSLSGQGWVPLGTMPAPGSRSCRSRCRCSLAYRTAGQEAA